MTVDLERALHDHFAPARDAELPEGSWERLEARLAADLSRGDGEESTGPRRHRLLLAAAVVAVVAVLGAVVGLAGQDDREPSRLDVTDSSPPTPEPGPETPEETPPPAPGPERPASTAVLVDTDEDGFSEAAVLHLDGTRFTFLPEVDDAPAGAVHVDVAPDGVVFYEICCEPAAGTVRAFDPATGTSWGEGTFATPTLDAGGPIITYGSFPEVSFDGTQLAVSVPGGVDGADGSFQILDLATGESRLVPDHGGEGTEVNGISWSPDGTRLAVERLRYGSGGIEEVLIDLVSLDDGTSTPMPLPPGGAALPAFLADGRLAVVLGGRDADGETRTATVALLDPESPGGVPDGGIPSARGLTPVRSLDVSADGTWIIAVDGNGWRRTFSTVDGLHEESTWGEGPPGVVGAAW